MTAPGARATEGHDYTEERAALLRLRWYVLLRWCGVVVFYASGLLAREIGHYHYSLTASNVLAPVAVAYNAVIWRLIRSWSSHPPADWQRTYRVLGNLQCSLDLIVLTGALHYAGGLETWALIEPIAVLVVAGLVLSGRDSVLQGLFTCVLIDAVVGAEASRHLHHVELGFLVPGLVRRPSYVASFMVVYDTVVLFILGVVLLLARQLRHRERELAGMYDRERQSVERLLEADRLKSDFLSAVSHELRTPLTAIRGFALTLNRRWEATPDATRRQQVSVIERQSARLQRLVSDLLDFSSLEAGKAVVNPEPRDLLELVEEAVASANTEGVSTDVAAGLTVMADPHRTEQILVNLLENAAKYGAPPVTVAAWPAAGQVTVTVEDQGPGVPDHAVHLLFGRFFQADSGLTRSSRGVGLGLALVKGYVEVQGGRVWYEPGAVGARFCFTLPQAASHPAVDTAAS
jgi:signal transduction histidine kinase